MLDRVDNEVLNRIRDIFLSDNSDNQDACKQKLEELKDDITSGLYPIHTALYAGDSNLLQKLIDLGEDINEEDSYGEIPINIAIKSDNSELITTLLNTGTKLNLNKKVTIDRLTPLHILVKENGQNCINHISALLKAGADVNAVDESGKTPLHYAAQTKNRDVINLLLDEGAKLDHVDKEGFTPFKDERRIAELHHGPRNKSAATKDFELVIKAFISDNPPNTSINRLGEIEVEINSKTYNLTKILEHKPDLEHLKLFTNMSPSEVERQKEIATKFFRDLTCYRLELNDSIPIDKRENMVIYEINMAYKHRRNSDKGELQLDKNKNGLICVLYSKYDVIIPWDELPGFPRNFTSIDDIKDHVNNILSALNKIDTSVITEPEARSIRYYTMADNNNKAFLKINRFLRQNGMIDDLTNPGTPDLRTIMMTIAYMTHAITSLREHHHETESAKYDTVKKHPNQDLYRGETYDTKNQASNLIKDRTGKTFTTGQGFVSTTAEKKVTETFTSNDEKSNIHIKFSQLENTYGVDISKYSEIANESEVLMMPGTQTIFRHSPYDDENALIAMPVRTVDEIYHESYQPDLINLRSDIIKLTDDYSKSDKPNEAMISALDTFCREFSKYEAGSLHGQIHACDKCLKALALAPQQVKSTHEYQNINDKLTEVFTIVNKRLDNYINDILYNTDYQDEISNFIETANHAYANHLSKSFKEADICGDDLVANINGIEIERPNHGLAHSIRTGLYIPIICQSFNNHAEDPEFREFMSQLNQEKMQLMMIAMLFYVTGRESEASWKDAPENVKAYRVAAGRNFRNYIEKHRVKEDKSHKSEFGEDNDAFITLLENILSNANFAEQMRQSSNTTGLYVLSIVDMAHRLDLLRCYRKEEVQDAINQSCDQINNYVDASFREKGLPVLLAMANDSLAANGDRRLTAYQGGKFRDPTEEERNRNDSFIEASTNPKACIKQCFAGNAVYLQVFDGKINIDLEKTTIKLTPLQNAVLKADSVELNKILNSEGFEDQQYKKLLEKVVEQLQSNDALTKEQLISFIKAEKNLDPGDMVVALHIALDAKKQDIALALIEKGADLNFTNERGETPLFIAAKRNLPQVIKEIAKNSETINKQDDGGHAPILAAAMRGSWDAVIELLNNPKTDLSGDIGAAVLCIVIGKNQEHIAKLILESKATIDIYFMSEPDKTALFYAIRNDMTEIAIELIKRGAAINSYSCFDDNYLNLALKYQQWDVVSHMLQDYTVDVNYLEYDKMKLFNYVIKHKLDQLIPTLLAKSVFCNTNDDASYPIPIAIKNRSSLAKELIIAAMADKAYPISQEQKFKIMLEAIYTGDNKLILFALNEMYIKDSINDLLYKGKTTGESILSHACSFGNTELVREIFNNLPKIDSNQLKNSIRDAVVNGKQDIVDFLIARGADVNSIYFNGMSLLSTAAYYKQWDIITNLLKCPGILIDNDSNSKADNFLQLLALSSSDQSKLFNKLINDENNNISETTIHKILCSLCENKYERHVTISDLFNSNRKININATNEKGMTPLQIAANNGNWVVVSELLDVPGININLHDKDQNSILHLASKAGELAIVEKIIHLIEERKIQIDVNELNAKGQSALCVAASNGSVDVVELLLRNQANPNAVKNSNDYHPIEIAAAKNHWPVVEAILNAKQFSGTQDTIEYNPEILFFHAVVHDEVKYIRQLINQENFKVGHMNEEGKTAFRYLVNRGDFDIMNELLKLPNLPGMANEINSVANDNHTPMSIAAYRQHWEFVLNLLKYPAATLSYDHPSTLSILCKACKDNRYDVIDAIFEKFPPDQQLLMHAIIEANRRDPMDGVKLLIQHMLQNGIDPNQQDQNGNTPLHLAAKMKNEDLLAILLSHGANPSIPNVYGTRVKDMKDLSYEMKECIASAYQSYEEDLEYHPIIKAAFSNNFDAVNKMISESDIELNNLQLERLLCYAIKDNQQETINQIMTKLSVISPYASIAGNDSLSLLSLAATHGNKELVQQLLAKMNNLNANDHVLRHAINSATHSDQWDNVAVLLKHLIQANQNSNRLSGFETLFFKALAADRADVVSLLMNTFEAGIKGALALTTEKKLNAVHLAAQYGSKQVTHELLSLIEASSLNVGKYAHDCIYLASKGKHWDIVSTYINRNDVNINYSSKRVESALLKMANAGQFELLKQIFTKYPDFYSCDKNKPSLFHKLVYSISSKNTENGADKLLAIMLAVNGNVTNAPDADGFTSLHLAARNNNPQLAKLLIQHGASVDVQDNNGKKPLDLVPTKDKLSSDAIENAMEIKKLLTPSKLSLSGKEHASFFGAHHKKTPAAKADEAHYEGSKKNNNI